MAFVYRVLKQYIDQKRSLHGAVANLLDCNIAVSEFELQSCDYTFVQIPLGKVWTPLFLFPPPHLL